MFIQQMEVGNLSVFAYLLAGDKGGAGLVIDPADEIDEIIALADRQKIKIKYILNTHAHVDHIMGNDEMKTRTGAQILIHEEDALRLTRVSPDRFSMFGGRPSPPADRTVKDGDLIQVGDLSLKVLHTPGHSPGAICLYLNNCVFTGDTLFVGGVGRTDLPGGSGEVLLHSIQTKLMTLPDETIVYPGHNYGAAPQSTIKQERLYNPYLRS